MEAILDFFANHFGVIPTLMLVAVILLGHWLAKEWRRRNDECAADFKKARAETAEASAAHLATVKDYSERFATITSENTAATRELTTMVGGLRDDLRGSRTNLPTLL